MHERSVFTTDPPVYAKLAQEYPELAEFLPIDWRNAEAVRVLNQVLLLHYFRLRVVIPAGQLVPTVASRVDYLLWLEDLLGSAAGASVTGVDIGTGPVAVYPLLAARLHAWHVLGVDSDAQAMNHAQETLAANCTDKDVQLAQHVVLAKVSGRTVLQEALTHVPTSWSTPLSFTMCNPPWFAHAAERAPRPGVAQDVATAAEQVAEGGEVGFVSRMIDESAADDASRLRVRWFTTLIGRKASIKPLLRRLRTHRVAVVRQGEIRIARTTRWLVAWSWYPMEPEEDEQTSGSSKRRRVARTSSSFSVATTAPDALFRSMVGFLRTRVPDLVVDQQSFRLSDGNKRWSIVLMRSAADRVEVVSTGAAEHFIALKQVFG